MRELSYKNESDVVYEATDSLLIGVVDDSKSEQKVEATISLLQHALRTKQPMCPFANLGGRFGNRLSRAAFSVLLKFSDGISAFHKLIEDVYLAEQSEEVSSEADKIQKQTKIIK